MTADPTVPLPDLDTALPLPGEQAPPADAAPTASAPQPRTRWAAIVWGACFAAIAWFGIWMLSTGERRSDISDWLASLDPATLTAFALLTIGALVLITGLVGLIRRAQRHRTDRD